MSSFSSDIDDSEFSEYGYSSGVEVSSAHEESSIDGSNYADSSKLDLVTVHGLSSKTGDEWQFIVDENRVLDPIPAHMIHYKYDAIDIIGEATPPSAIHDRAVELLDKIQPAGTVENRNKRPIVFAAHDLGGSIVKQALLIASREDKYREIASRTSLLIFFGTPHRVRDSHCWKDILSSNILPFLPDPYGIWFPNFIQLLAQYHKTLSEEFYTIAQNFRILDFYRRAGETETCQPIIEKYVGTLDTPWEDRIGQEGSHPLVGQFLSGEKFRFLRERISDVSTSLDKQYLDCLESLSIETPEGTKIYQSSLSSQCLFDCILSHPSYNSWEKAASPSVLQLQWKEALRSKALINSLAKLLQENSSRCRAIFASFSFDRQSVRRDSIVQMLASLSLQLLYQRPGLFSQVQHLYDAFKTKGTWTEQQMWMLFRTLLSRPNGHQVTCIINAIQNCDASYIRFLKNLSSLIGSTEERFRIIIIIQGHFDVIIGPPETCFEIDLNKLDTNSNTRKELKSAVDLLAQTKPVFDEFRDEIVEQFAGSMVTDCVWAISCLDHLKASRIRSTPSATHRQLETLCITAPERIFTAILQGVPEDDHPWVQNALTWISYAFRPLNFGELATALAIGDLEVSATSINNETARDITNDLRRTLTGLVEIGDRGVWLVHERVKDFVVQKPTNAPEWYSVKSTAHVDIAHYCLSYLSSYSMEDFHFTTTSLHYNSRVFYNRDSPNSFLEYATKYWPMHYRLGMESPDIDDRFIMEFLQGSTNLQLWSELYQYFRGPYVKQNLDQLNPSPLFISAYFGLTKTVKLILQDPNSLLDTENDLETALLVATQRGHIDAVRCLTHHKTFSPVVIMEAIRRASECGHGDIMQELIKFAKDKAIDDNAVALLYDNIRDGNARIVEHLIRRCSDADFKNGISMPLHVAAEHGHLSIVKILLTMTHLEINWKNDDGMIALHLAAANGHESIVEQLLRSGAEINSTDSAGRSPLHLASEYGYLQIVKRLLHHGAKIDLIDNRKRTALHMASWNGHCGVVRELLEKTAEINAEDEEENSALHLAVKGGHTNLVQVLIEYESRLDALDYLGRTPLVTATEKGLETIAVQLIENGAGVNDTFDDQTILTLAAGGGYTAVAKALLNHNASVEAKETTRGPLHVASVNGYPQIVRLLLDIGANPIAKDARGGTAMHLACRNERVEVVEELLRQKLELCTIDAWNETPLEDAARSGNKKIIELLLRYYGSDTKMRFAEHLHMSLHITALSGHEETVRLLLDAGADQDYQDDSGNTALHLAAQNSRSQVVLLLLVRRPDLELKEIMGRTALFEAASENSIECLKLLLDAGANKDPEDDDGDTPLTKAASKNNNEAVELLLERGAKMKSPNINYNNLLQFAVDKCSTSVVKALLNHGADQNSAHSIYGYPLQSASLNGNIETVQLLLDVGADINSVSGSYGTTLQAAAHKGSQEIVELLLRYSADVNKRSGFYCTALQAAACQRHRDAIVKILLDHGANVNILGGTWGSALHGAAAQSTSLVVKLLLEHEASVNKKDVQGRLPVHLASWGDNWDLVELVTSKESHIDCIDKQGRRGLHFAAASGAMSVLRQIVKRQEYRDVPDADGWISLHWACRQTNAEVIKLLLEHGSNPLHKSCRGWTPRDVAIFHGNDQLLELLPSEIENPSNEKNLVAGQEEPTTFICDGCLCVSVPMVN
ncbi:MAG: hypothetical protein M1834_000012 [Cirrosporium novae-zelandiae]|nr:MAG: hypothetical protein M1834_000012 [Cirrosporium novae-zelandiae]